METKGLLNENMFPNRSDPWENPSKTSKNDPWGMASKSESTLPMTFHSGEYQWGSLEDFRQFKQGYNTTSSQFGSTENLPWAVNQSDKTEFSTMFGTMTDDSNNTNGLALSVFSMMENNDVGPFDTFDIKVELKKKERRFGFSVMGGRDEGFRPRIDDVAKGSPADRAELEIGDEILEVNGRSLENSSHAEVISYIHKCIKTRSICLRVKRKKHSVEDTVPQIDHVQDAYMIAVEDEAKKRLEKLSAVHAVTAIDMTKIAYSNGENEENSQNSGVLVEKNSVYKSTSMPVNNKGQHVGNGHVEMMEMNGFMEKQSSKKGKGKKENRHSKSNSTDTPLIENINQQNILTYSQNSLNHSSDNNLYDGEESDVHIHNSFDVDDSGPHKEMAVDCPESFIATIKSPPRYPPPPPSLTQSSGQSSPSAPPTTPLKTLNNKNDQTRTDNTLTNAANVVANSIQNNQQSLNEDQLERLRKHQEELRKRREEENRLAKEQDFLRTSLRGSKKLQALESKKPVGVEGVVNTAFVENDDDFDNTDDGFGSARAPSEKDRYMRKNISIDDLFSSLRYMQNRLSAAEERDELSFLKSLFQNKQFQNAIDIHNKIIDVNTRSPPCKPLCTNSVELSNDVITAVQDTQAPYANDLVDLLCEPAFKNLLASHDQIAENELQPAISGPEDDFMDYPLQQFGEETVKIVHLEKTNEPLGATVRNEGESVIIGRIVKGGTAEKSGLLHEGDEILEVNGIDMKGKNINDVSEMLANMSGTITFMIIPALTEFSKPSPREDEVMHIKALYNYDPEDDIYIPCRELGISFMKGDILHVLNQEDPNWWQAYREGEQEHQSLAGLIPSRSFQEMRESMKHTLGGENKENQKKGRSCTCGKRDKKRKKKSAYKENTEEREEILTYEEVELYYPQPNRKRPIVLIGPPNVGRHDLRQRLMESDYERFAAAVPHTSRPKDDHEIDGKDYHFVPRAIFEADIMANKFVEHGEYEKNLYGTSLNAIRQVINQGKICILNLHPESLEMLKTSDLKPYVVFVYPQNMEKLRQIQQKFGLDKITDENLTEIIERAREMEDKYGHYFDYILVNSDMDRAYDDLLIEINRLEVEAQWVPQQWIGN